MFITSDDETNSREAKAMNVIDLAEWERRRRGNYGNRNPRQVLCGKGGKPHREESIGEIATRIVESLRG
jgi:hypothetical protein